MRRFVEGENRRQPALLPSSLEDYVDEDNPACVVDAFVDELDLAALGFAVVPSSRRLEREARIIIRLGRLGVNLSRIRFALMLEHEH